MANKKAYPLNAKIGSSLMPFDNPSILSRTGGFASPGYPDFAFSLTICALILVAYSYQRSVSISIQIDIMILSSIILNYIIFSYNTW